MAESQADRLKRELRFLQESYEAGIISEEEYNKGKNRIEGKLSEWGEGVVEKYGDEEKQIKEIIEPEEKNSKGSAKQEKLKIFEKKEDKKEIKRQKKEMKKDSMTVEELPAESKKKEIFDDDFDKENNSIGSKIWRIAAVIVIAAIIILLFRGCGRYSINTDYVILNDKNCGSCDTRGAENVIDRLFPGMSKSYVDYNTREGKAMYNDLGIKYLPAYIFKISIQETETWESRPNIRDSFEKVKDYWVLKAEQTDSEWEP